jgi:hypothetical protein
VAAASNRWRRWVASLRDTFPPPDGRPVRVIRRALADGSYGLTTRTERGWTIAIDERLPDSIAWLILVHEWPHMFAWDNAIDHSDCGRPCNHWGCWHARIWRDNHAETDHEI